MKVITIGTDRKIFEQGSSVQKRQIEYGKLFEKLEIVVFSDRNRNQESRIQLSENVFAYPTNSRNKLFYISDAFLIIKKLILSSKPQFAYSVVSTQDPFETGIVGVVLKILFGLPLHIQLHTDFNNKYFVLHSPLNFVRLILAHITLPFADSVRCVSEKVAKGVRELNPNVSILPISQDLKLVDVGEKKEFKGKLLTVCRLEREKDLDTAIKAFAKLLVKYKEATFTIVGDGSQRKSLEFLAKNLGVEDRIKFVGWQNDLSIFYREADIYISTSLFEGYGMSMVEAALHSLPLVLSEAGIAEEYFKDNGALLCKPKDVDAFYKSLLVLFKDEESRTKMGSKARRSAESKMIGWQDYTGLYKKNLESVKNNSPKNIFYRVFLFIKSIINGNKILRFVIAGGLSAFTQIFTLYLFTDILKIWYLHSSIMAFCIALVVSFSLQKLWAFKDKNISGMHHQFFKYTLIALLGLLFNTICMYVGVDILGIWYVFNQIITGFFIAVFNFVMYRKFIFKN